MKLDIKQTKIPGCFELFPEILRDERGFFVKTFHEDMFRKNGLRAHFSEEYFTFSHRGVLRGLHFQMPPMDHVKLVCCVYGKVFDAVVDLRANSPNFGDFETFELSADKSNMIYIPEGLAHGFYVRSETAIMSYKVTTVYSPQHDAGLLWNSVNIPWPCDNPVISDRDSELTCIKYFNSPFVYGKSK